MSSSSCWVIRRKEEKKKKGHILRYTKRKVRNVGESYGEDDKIENKGNIHVIKLKSKIKG